VHPTPIYELIAGLLIAWWLWKRGSKRTGDGAIVGQYLILTGLARFLVEFLRRNPHILFGLSNAQLASIGSVAAGVVLIWVASKRVTPEPKEPAEMAEAA
jgi:phosphatidylglycerol:prolipoprotein diacylglycerol transferase